MLNAGNVVSTTGNWLYKHLNDKVGRLLLTASIQHHPASVYHKAATLLHLLQRERLHSVN